MLNGNRKRVFNETKKIKIKKIRIKVVQEIPFNELKIIGFNGSWAGWFEMVEMVGSARDEKEIKKCLFQAICENNSFIIFITVEL